jgi:phosphoribosylglycinamide formyltransferase-1
VTVPVAVLISGSGTNLQALIDAAGTSAGFRVALVVSNKRDAYGLERARAAGIPAEWLPARKGEPREAYDAALVDLLRANGVEWVCMAGFMRLVTPVLLDAFPWRVLNIHPALLPAFPGLHAQQQAFDAGVRITGATVHLVDGGMDTGPIVAQGAVPVMPSDSVDTLQQRILRMEHRLYPLVLRWAASGRLSVVDGRAHVESDEPRFLFDPTA